MFRSKVLVMLLAAVCFSLALTGITAVFAQIPEEADEAFHNLLASIRMDGLVYFTGYRNHQHLSYGTYRYGKASTKGSADFVLVVDNGKASVYLDGRRVVQKAELPVMGDGVGLCTLSGTNKDYGTRCTYKDIFFYSW